MSPITYIIFFVCSFAVWLLYHKLFHVIYFDFGYGCLKELIISALFGAILAALIMKFWYIALIVGVLIVYAIMKKGQPPSDNDNNNSNSGDSTNE